MTHLHDVSFDDVDNLKFHEFLIVACDEHEISPRLIILRVAGGWIYTIVDENVYETHPTHSSTFVPYSNKP